MQGHTLDELHQSFWVEHLYISIKKNVCVPMCACGGRRLISAVFLGLALPYFWHGFLTEPRTQDSARVPGHYTPGSVTACSRAGVAGACCRRWHFMWVLGIWTQLSCLPSDLLTEPLSRPCISICAARLRCLPQAKACAERPVCPAGLSRVTLSSGVTWHDSGFIPVKGDTISFLM